MHFSRHMFEALEARRFLAASPVALYTFEEGSGGTTADNSGGGYTGSLVGSAGFAEGLIARYGMSFNGTTSAVHVLNAAALNPTSQITVSAWINPTDWNGNRRIIQKGDIDNQYRLTAESGVLRWHIAGKPVVSAALPSTGQWHHVAGTYDGTMLRLYVDGQPVASIAATGAIPTTTNTLYIGTKNSGAPAGDRFIGRMDDARVYSVALNDVEVQRLAGIVNVNFQPSASAVPAKFLVDSGALFGVRGNGHSYGWNVLHDDTAADRNIAADQRLDTLIRQHSSAMWEIQVANGTYEVIASLGDPQQASTHTLTVEGASFATNLALAANQFQTIRQTVVVADGRISISNGSAAEEATRLNYVQVLTVDLAPSDPPAMPTINEPDFDGKIVDPADVHMEAPDYFDPSGDPHGSSDWEIRVVATDELVWEAAAVTGVEKVHLHLGDGEFIGSLTGRAELLPHTDYILRVRHRDINGAASLFAVRLFTTGDRSAAVALGIEDVADAPAPQWKRASDQVPVELPVGTSMSMEGHEDELLLQVDGQSAAGNSVINPPALPEHAHPRIVLSATSAALILPQTNLTFTDDSARSHIVYLPEVSLAPGGSAYFWIGTDGSTYVGDELQTEPDLSTPARLAPIPFLASQPGYVVETFSTGFQLPVNIAFVPDPGPDPDDVLFYVTELYGTIKAVNRDGTFNTYATGLLNFNPTGNFPGSGEQGLAGLVVDPATGDLYAGMVYSTNPSNDAAAHYPKVVRFTSTDGGRTAATQTMILNMVGEDMGQSHFISNFSLGPDEKLYVHLGDGFDVSTAQNLSRFRGKIIRMNLDGTAAVGNPFYDASNGITARDYVYAYGFRNPFGGAWRELDGKHHEVENGPSIDRLVQVNPGQNYLWNGSDASMMNFAIYNWNPSSAPVNMQFIQNSVFGGSGFPTSKFDHLFITESGPTYASGVPGVGKKISEFVLDAAGNLSSGPVDFVTYAGSGKGSFSALAAGPDGLYFSELYKDQDYTTPIDHGARIFRVRFIGSIPPEVTIAPLTTTDRTPALEGTVGDPSATVSVTVDGQTHSANNNGDGTWALADNVLKSLPDGTYDVQVAATNSFNTIGNDATTAELIIDATPPQISGLEFLFDAPILPGRVHTIQFVVSEDIVGTLGVEDLSVINRFTEAAVGGIELDFDSITGIARVTFSALPGGALPDGNYRFTLAAGSISDPIGNALEANQQLDFFVLAGDATQDRVVDARDLVVLAENWFGTGKTFSQGDFNYDGTVDQADLTTMAQKWQLKLDPPPSAGPAAPAVAGRRSPIRTPSRMILELGA